MGKDKAPDETNVMRLLDQAGIECTQRFYDPEETAGEAVAALLGEPPECVFKTLVTVSDRGDHFVFVIPVTGSLDLTKAARAAGRKSVVMIKQKELLPLTGYVHGGCSPVGMKKPFPTFIDETALLSDKIYVSAGMRGVQLIVAPEPLCAFVDGHFADLIR